ELAEELGTEGPTANNHLGELFQELDRLCLGITLLNEIGPRIQARLLSLGELILTRIGHEFLCKQGLACAFYDARKFFKIQSNPLLPAFREYLNATANDDFNSEVHGIFSQEQSPVIITQGFIASNQNQETVLLGRGGSDTSGAVIAAQIRAHRLEIWTDVPGMYTANPHLVPEARMLKLLNYDEAQEMASTGAKVLHPRCLPPVKKANIPLHIYCTDHPQLSGTVITAVKQSSEGMVKSISMKTGITLISIENIQMWQEVGFLAELFGRFKKYGLSIDLLSTSEANVTLSLDSAVKYTPEVLENLLHDLGDLGTARTIGPCGMISIVGKNIRSIIHKIGHLFNVFEEQQIYLMSQAASDLNLSFVINEDQCLRLVKELHLLLFDNLEHNELFGKPWQETFQKTFQETFDGQPAPYLRWWQKNSEQLLSYFNDKHGDTPSFIYSEQELINNIARIKKLTAIDQFFYAIKANYNPRILKLFYEQGLGFETVSLCELQHLKKVIPHIDYQRVIFTPNFAHPEEYQSAFALGAQVIVDSLYPLKNWGHLFAKRQIFLRIDPGQGSGAHKYIRTGGKNSKFGISLEEVAECAAVCRQQKTDVIGLHVHGGSNIDRAEHWKEMALLLAKVAEQFLGVKTIDVGGGAFVPYRPQEKELDLKLTNELLLKFKSLYPQYKLWIEPGRFMVAAAGVLLCRVTQLKQKEGINYIGIDAGMNSLIRPALYGAYHHICNLSKYHHQSAMSALSAHKEFSAHVVGPICESGDVLGYNRQLPLTTSEGDILLIDTVGAYAYVMSSHYNLRPPAKEVFYGNDKSFSSAPSPT
ncbi:MAG: bifunctional aspartate kinase/diaminopimelate decarboxylase, partial [Oligoflexia bacterium]|nr:bifunctional aspartate kinase/diaminopimelate decarboxylase [Oligoflexia bacterium]